jgi:hypothetical protein
LRPDCRPARLARNRGARLSSPKKLEKDLRELTCMRHARARLSLGSREKNGKSFAGRRPQTFRPRASQ